MAEYIDREAFKKEYLCCGYLPEMSETEFNAFPAADVAPVRHGRWVNPYINFYGHPCHCCSECGFKASYQDNNYCPNCGAKMDGEEGE